ncbi:MAG TPA: Cof-type HAD-IIB family hydrolase [Fimbriimonadaceae bacterium]|nr:Cof-type HAD-IIB family hydrolase [Fimbriimonadaceae bacterium]
MAIEQSPIRLLAIDLDGTLLTSEKQITQRSLNAIRSAQRAGVTVVLASGRIRPSMLPFAKRTGLDTGPMVSGNGSHLLLSASETLHRLFLDKSALRTITDYAWSSNLHLNIYTEDELYFLRDTPWGDLYRSRVDSVVPKLLDRSVEELPVLKVLLVDHPVEIPNHLTILRELVPTDKARATESEPEYLEFMNPSATKGFAIAALVSHLGFDQDEVAAIGDYLNDLEMLEFVGLSGAVANAHSAVLDLAKIHVSSNDSDGVAQFIENHVLKQ